MPQAEDSKKSFRHFFIRTVKTYRWLYVTLVLVLLYFLSLPHIRFVVVTILFPTFLLSALIFTLVFSALDMAEQRRGQKKRD